MDLAFREFTILETNRTIIRRIEMRDVHDIYDLRSDPELFEYTEKKADSNFDNAVKFIKSVNKNKKKLIYFGIVNKENNKLIGLINFWNYDRFKNEVEVGYSLSAKYQGQGFMDEALSKLLQFAYIHANFKKVKAFIDSRNDKSLRLVERLNFSYTNREVYYDTKYKRQFVYFIYTLERTEFIKHEIL